MTTPITRKQLRKALWDAEAERDTYRRRAKNTQDALDSLKKSIREDGWTPQRQIGVDIDGVLNTTTRWTAPDRKAEREKLIAETRRETLKKVIEALGIKGYEPSYNFALMSACGIEGLDEPEVDRFWDDLNDAIALRQERAAAARRAENEERISKLTAVAPLAKKTKKDE